MFALSFDDFVLSFFTTGESPQPLPVRIWSAIRFGVTPTINAIGTLMLAISAICDRARGGPAAAARAARERARRPNGEGGGMSEAVRFEGVTKRFGSATAVDDLNLTIEARRVLLAARAVGLRQDDDAADGGRLRAADRGPGLPRRRAGGDRAALQAQRQHGVPELRAVRAPRHRGQRRLRAQAAQGARRTEIEHARGRGARARAADRAREREARTSSPAASASASRSRARSSTGPRCCCSTSRSARSTSSCASRCRSS